MIPDKDPALREEIEKRCKNNKYFADIETGKVYSIADPKFTFNISYGCLNIKYSNKESCYFANIASCLFIKSPKEYNEALVSYLKEYKNNYGCGMVSLKKYYKNCKLICCYDTYIIHDSLDNAANIIKNSFGYKNLFENNNKYLIPTKAEISSNDFNINLAENDVFIHASKFAGHINIEDFIIGFQDKSAIGKSIQREKIKYQKKIASLEKQLKKKKDTLKKLDEIIDKLPDEEKLLIEIE